MHSHADSFYLCPSRPLRWTHPLKRMAELALGFVGAAATVGAAALSTDSGFTRRHESSHREEMMETRRSMDDFKTNLQCGDVTQKETTEFLTAKVIQRQNEYRESIESYKQVPWFGVLGKLKKRKDVRTAKRLTRKYNYRLRNLNEWSEGAGCRDSNFNGGVDMYRTLLVSNSMFGIRPPDSPSSVSGDRTRSEETCEFNYTNSIDHMLSDEQHLAALNHLIDMKHERLLNTLIKTQRSADKNRIASLNRNSSANITSFCSKRPYSVARKPFHSARLERLDFPEECDANGSLLYFRSPQRPLNVWWNGQSNAVESFTLRSLHEDQIWQWEAEINRLMVAAQHRRSGAPADDCARLPVQNVTVRVKIHFKEEISPVTEYDALVETVRRKIRLEREDRAW
ncbi:hypothetical protein C8R44DRAFT_889525 [Mycena epipterygia]|nr:hypothetical protein C8R44DRAFT_889525 [Mycena epipterygia]